MHLSWPSTDAVPVSAWTLRNRLIVAAEEHKEHQELFDVFTSRLEAVHVTAWTVQIVAWEKDQSLPDPYQMVVSGTITHLSLCCKCLVLIVHL